ncbi:serine protease 56 [Mauremys reevesii]|uniref:serine protease 56 n=1 Tax=Mauremys reevesii TaxID=260615 RepID=UPI00193F8634|nr:serine protease 56 [Mauremys reevesii]
MLLPLLCLLQLTAGAPLGKELHQMPASVLQAGPEVTHPLYASRGERETETRAVLVVRAVGARRVRGGEVGEPSSPILPLARGPHTLSSRGTLVLEAALKSALVALQGVLAEHEQRLRECGECAPCLSGDCGNRSRECARLESDMDDMNVLSDQPAPGTCGQGVVAPNATAAKGKIVGGSVAPRGAWPWLVSVRLGGELMCGGVLVGDTWVLTAAHCFAGNRNELAWTVVVGDYDLAKWDEGEQVLPVNRIITHPKFNPKTFHSDVALLELARPVAPSARLSPVCLPEGPEEPGPGTPCYIAGWGSLYQEGPSAEVVMEARVPVLSQDACRSALGKELLTSAMFCAGYLAGGIDSCQGDSGGPLTCQESGSQQSVLYGITSWGDGCGEQGKPGVYTRVTAFADWIRRQMDKSPESREPTCFELLAASQLPGERQHAELAHLCAFYAQSCAPPQGQAACARVAEETCRMKRRRCELRSYAQMLLDFLRQAEEFFRNQVDFAFFTHTLPRFMEQLYGHLFPVRARRATTGQGAEGQASPEELPSVPNRTRPPPFLALFQAVGPTLEDWVGELNAMAGGDMAPPALALAAGQLHGEEQLFLQQAEGAVEALKGHSWAFLQRLRAELGARGAGPEPGAASPLNRPAAAGDRSLRARRELGGAHPSDEGPGDRRGCPGLQEAALQVHAMRELYRWVLQVPERDLAMTFQEILVDLGSKNAKGLYRARVRATVGGKATVFPALVGLESDSLYRSMPGLIALALAALQT